MALLATVSIVAGCASTPTSSPSVAASSLSSSSTVPPPVSASSAAVSPPAGAAPSLATSDIFGGGIGTVFASPHFGYAVSVPGDWLVTPASASWRSTGLRYGSPSLDVAGGGGVRFTGTSQPLRAQTPDTWVRAYAAALGLSACVGATDDTFTIEALPATTILGGCADPSGQTGIGHGRRYDVVVTAGGRGYDFRLDGDVDAGMVRQILDTVHLRPADASAIDRVYLGPGSDFSVLCAGVPCMDVHVVAVFGRGGPPHRFVIVPLAVDVRMRVTVTGPGAVLSPADWQWSNEGVPDGTGATFVSGGPVSTTRGPRPLLPTGPLSLGTTVDGWIDIPVLSDPVVVRYEPPSQARQSVVFGERAVARIAVARG